MRSRSVGTSGSGTVLSGCNGPVRSGIDFSQAAACRRKAPIAPFDMPEQCLRTPALLPSDDRLQF